MFGIAFLYARLQTGRIMVWWCLSVRVSVRPTLRPSVQVSIRQFSTLFSNMLWHIELKFCIWLCFTVLQIKFECRQFPVKFCASYAPFVTYNTGNTQFSALFSNMLCHIELKFCIWLCFTVLQIKFECRQFPSSFVRVYAPFVTYNTGNTQFSALFSNMLWHIELKFCIWLWFTVLQIKFECRHFASIFVGVMPFWNLQYWKYTVFRAFSLTCFDILSWKFSYDFV